MQKFVPLAEESQSAAAGIAAETDDAPRVRLTHITGAVALSFAICAGADAIAGALGMGQYTILFITVLTIAVANLFPGAMRKLEGEFEVGMLLMYLFFAIVGAGTDATSFLGDAVVLFFLWDDHHPDTPGYCPAGSPTAGHRSGRSCGLHPGQRWLARRLPPRSLFLVVGSISLPRASCAEFFGYVIATFVGVMVTAALS